MSRITNLSNDLRSKLLRQVINTELLLTPIADAVLTRRRARKIIRYAPKRCSKWASTSRAIADLERALNSAPDDIAANRRMLAFAEGARKSEAALNLISRERDVKMLREAIEVLRADGRWHVAHAIAYDEAVRGWAVWQGDRALEITISSDAGVLTSLVEANPSHAFADLGRAANFDLRRPKSDASQSVTVSVAGEVIYSTRAAGE